MKNAINKQNQRIGILTAYTESTGKKAKSLAQACKYFGIKKP